MTNPCSLWMGDLESWMDEDFVKQAFNQMGENILGVKIINHKTSGMPAGYCFVEFPDADEGRRAMLRLSGKVIPGSKPPKLFKLNHASFGREHLRNQEYSLFIGDLTEEVDDLMLYSTFQRKYKSVKAAKVVIDQQGQSRGYGFIRFGEEEEQKAALVEMQKYIGLGRKAIKVSVATPKRRPTTNYSNTSGSHMSSMSQGYYHGAGTGGHHQYGQQPYYPGNPNSWWQAYQPPGSSYYPPPTYPGQGGSGSSGDYSQDYQGTSQTQSQEDPEEELEDPELEIDVAKENEKFMERSEELYIALEGSRWHPLDNVMSPISTSSK